MKYNLSREHRNTVCRAKILKKRQFLQTQILKKDTYDDGPMFHVRRTGRGRNRRGKKAEKRTLEPRSDYVNVTKKKRDRIRNRGVELDPLYE